MTTDPQLAQTSGGRGAHQRILDAATELFYRVGINATGVERLASAATVSKRTLYQHFPSKAAVIKAYLRHVEGAVGFAPAAPDLTPCQRLLALFDPPLPDENGLIRGCPFHNAAVEAAGAMPEVQQVVQAHKRAYIATVTELAEQAGATDSQSLGNQLTVLLEGAAALATSLNDPASWTHARTAARSLIAHAITQDKSQPKISKS